MPEFFPALRPICELAAFMAMPKASMNKYNGLMTWQHNVGLSRQISSMKPKSQSHAVE